MENSCSLLVVVAVETVPAFGSRSYFVSPHHENQASHIRFIPISAVSIQPLPWAEQKRVFLTSDEIWFKPVQLHNGPDGALYVVDMYRDVFEHPDAVPPSVRKHIDLNTGNDRGRIYRVVPEGLELKINKQEMADLLAYLLTVIER